MNSKNKIVNIIALIIPFILISCHSIIITKSVTTQLFTQTNLNTISSNIEITPASKKTIEPTNKSNIETNTPTVTNTSVGLSKQGPWLVFDADDGLWAMNSDGTGITRIIKLPDLYGNSNSGPGGITYFPFMAAPRGNQLAFSLEKSGEEQSSVLLDHYLNYEPYLKIMTFPDLSIKTITTLFSSTQVHAITQNQPEIGSQDQLDQLDQVEAAIKRSGSLAWSSTGDQLAFTAAIDGPSSDVYLLDLNTSRIIRLTNGPTTQAIQLYWSPDDKYVINTAAKDILPRNNEFSGGYGDIWVADSDGGDVYKILSSNDYIKSWFTNEDILVASIDGNCPIEPYNLRKKNIHTMENIPVWNGLFDDADIEPDTKTVLIGTTIKEEYLVGFQCAQLISPGIYLFEKGSNNPRIINIFTKEYFQKPLHIAWSNILKRFIIQSSNGISLVSTSGEALSIIKTNSSKDSEIYSNPIISPNGQYWVLESTTSSGLWIRKQDGKIMNIYNKPTCKVSWRPDSNAILFTDGREMFIAEAPIFTARIIASGFSIPCDLDFQWVQ